MALNGIIQSRSATREHKVEAQKTLVVVTTEVNALERELVWLEAQR